MCGRCPFSPKIDEQKGVLILETELTDENSMPLEDFFNLIPKPILEQMQSENISIEKHNNNIEIKTLNLNNDENIYQSNEKSFYHGEVNEKGEKDGVGKMVIINSKNERIYYHGIWQKNELIKGFIYYSNISKYKGEIKNFLRNGKGEYISETETYIGDWKEDQKDGEGVIKYTDGIEYKGQFKKDKFNGRGEMTWPDGTYYSGDFCHNVFHGKGYLKGNNTHTYNGYFSRGLFNGEGEFIWTKGVNMNRYKGNYSSGKKDGMGELYFNNGNVYRGGWESGIPQGEGIYETKNRKYYGNWRSGIFLQLIKVEDKEGCEEENINLNFQTPLEDIEIKGNFKLSNNSEFSSTYNTYNDVLVEIVKQN